MATAFGRPTERRGEVVDDLAVQAQAETDKETGSQFGQKLVQFGLPAALAGVAAAIGARHGMGPEGAVSFLSGYLGGARNASLVAFQQKMEQEQLALQKQQEGRLGFQQLGPAASPETRAGLFRQGVGDANAPAPMSNFEIQARDNVLRIWGNQLTAASPRQASKALRSLGRSFGDQTFDQMAQALEDSVLNPEEAAALKPILSEFSRILGIKDISPDRAYELWSSSPEYREMVQNWVETVTDPVTAAKAEAYRSLAGKRNVEAGVAGDVGAARVGLYGAQTALTQAKYDAALKDRLTPGSDPTKVILQVASQLALAEYRESQNILSGQKPMTGAELSARFDTHVVNLSQRVGHQLGTAPPVVPRDQIEAAKAAAAANVLRKDEDGTTLLNGIAIDDDMLKFADEIP